MQITTLTANIDKSLCVACGMCADVCPSVFRMGSDGFAEAIVACSMEFFDDAWDAAMDCPAGAITIHCASQ
ncbi:ferredoxin [uncultured Selenomonas sp.]|uniref:ferredoxin n=1 Tax=uncultured Selenomonas sp. TaxID=159275 RepID=UPI0025DCE739|nr:ferredoxin [uncultured Selenomonas sp.]